MPAAPAFFSIFVVLGNQQIKRLRFLRFMCSPDCAAFFPHLRFQTFQTSILLGSYSRVRNLRFIRDLFHSFLQLKSILLVNFSMSVVSHSSLIVFKRGSLGKTPTDIKKLESPAFGVTNR